MNRQTEIIEKGIEDKLRNTKLELKIISYGLRKNHLIFSKLIPDYFTIKFYKNIVNKIGKQGEKIFEKNSFAHWIKKNFDEVERVDAESFLEKIFSEKILSLDIQKSEAMVSTLSDLYELRKIMLTVSDVVEMTSSDNFDTRKIKEKLRNCLTIEKHDSENFSGDYLADFEERKNELIKRRDNPESFGSTFFGIKPLDDITGGIFSGETCYMMAPSGFGKTIFLQNVACNCFLRKKNVAFFTLEMPKKEVGYRIDARLVKMKFSQFRKATLSDEEIALYEERINLYKEKLEGIGFEIISFRRGGTPKEMEEEILRVQDKRKKEFDVVIGDYINLMSSNNSKNRIIDNKDWKAQGDVSWDLKKMAENLNVPFISAGQVTDDFSHKKPSLANMKYSRGITENANIILALTQTDDDYLEGVVKLHYLKMRSAPKIEPSKLINDYDLMTIDKEMFEIERGLLFGRKK